MTFINVAVASATRIDEVLSTHPAIVDNVRGQTLPAGHGELRFEKVTFAYLPADGSEPPPGPAGQPDKVAPPAVLEDLDLVVNPGEAVALVGATGSGKSTVAKLIPRFYEPLAGRITIADLDAHRAFVATLGPKAIWLDYAREEDHAVHAGT